MATGRRRDGTELGNSRLARQEMPNAKQADIAIRN